MSLKSGGEEEEERSPVWSKKGKETADGDEIQRGGTKWQKEGGGRVRPVLLGVKGFEKKRAEASSRGEGAGKQKKRAKCLNGSRKPRAYSRAKGGAQG